MKEILKIVWVAGALLAVIHSAFCQTKQFGSPKSFVYDISFSEGGSLLALTEGNTVKLYDVMSDKLLKSFRDRHSAEVLTVALSADSAQLVSGGKDGQVILWNLQSAASVSLKGHQGVVTAARFHPSGKIVVSAGSDNKVLVHELASHKVLYELTQHTDDVTAIAISPDGNILASGSGDKTICLWDLQSGKLLSQLNNQHEWVRSLAFSKDGKKLFSGGDDGRYKTWNIESPESTYQIAERKIKTGWTLGLDQLGSSPENESIAYAGSNGRVGIKTAFTDYQYKIGTAAHKILFQPKQGIYLKIAVATNGKGVIIIKAESMDEKEL